jgi:hypothetical protein
MASALRPWKQLARIRQLGCNRERQQTAEEQGNSNSKEQESDEDRRRSLLFWLADHGGLFGRRGYSTTFP